MEIKHYNSISALALLSILIIVIFFPTWKTLVEFWHSNDDYSHGFLIVPISLFLSLRIYRYSKDLPFTGSSWGLMLLVVSLFAYVVARFAEINTLASLMIVATVFSIVLYIFSPDHTWRYLFPILFLVFMIPIPAQVFSLLTIPLQLFVSAASCAVARIIDIPVLREGNILQLPGHTMQVVQACSGLRSLVSIMMICALLGYMSLKLNLSRVVLCLFAVPVAIFVNIFRVSLMIVFLYFFDVNLAVGAAHTATGVLVFVLAVASILVFKGLLEKWEKRF